MLELSRLSTFYDYIYLTHFILYIEGFLYSIKYYININMSETFIRQKNLLDGQNAIMCNTCALLKFRNIKQVVIHIRYA